MAVVSAVKGQAHDNSKGGCKLARNHISTGYTCPACEAKDKRDQAARDAENKRRNDAIIAKATAERKAKEIAYKKEQEERAAKNKVTEVFIKMPSSSSSSSSSASTSSASSSSAATENTSNSTSAEESTSSTSTSSSDVTVHNNIFAAENARKYNQQKLIADGAKLMGDFFDNWQANREKKWAKEKQENERYKEKVELDREAYSNFVTSQNNSLFKNLSNYQAMLKLMVPKVLSSKSITWEDIIGSPDYNNAFGKDVKSISRKLKITLPKDKAKSPIENVSADELPKHFSHSNLYYAYANQTFFYWVKDDFYEHSQAYIFDSNDVLVGIKMALHTSSREDKAFPSSLYEYLPLKSYYDDLKKNTNGNYFLADAKTLITRDKIFILDFESLTIYDLKYFDVNTLFNLPNDFKPYFKSRDVNKIGIKFQGFREDETKKITKVRITEVDKNSAAGKAGLMPGDLILSVNDMVIDFPFHLQWYFLAFPDERNINLKIERDKKIDHISIKL